MGFYKIGKVVLKSLFKKPATLMYPVIPRTWQDRTRGNIGIEENACILCGICSKKCPTNAIAVSREQRTWIIERMQCIQCGSCVEACPKKCLLMNKEYTTPSTAKIVDTILIPEVPKPEAPQAAQAAAAPQAIATPQAAPKAPETAAAPQTAPSAPEAVAMPAPPEATAAAPQAAPSAQAETDAPAAS